MKPKKEKELIKQLDQELKEYRETGLINVPYEELKFDKLYPKKQN